MISDPFFEFLQIERTCINIFQDSTRCHQANEIIDINKEI